MDYATEGRTVMEKQIGKKGNYIDFTEAICPKRKDREAFLDQLYKRGETPEQLLNYFHRLGYDGVSLQDCGKLIKGKKKCPYRPKIVDEKY